MVDLPSEQDLAVSYTGHPRGGASFVDAKRDGLNVPLTGPGELNGKGRCSTTLALPVCNSFRALAGVQGINGVLS